MIVQVPRGWTRVSVEDLATPEPGSLTDGPFGSNLKGSHYTDNGARVIRLQNIGDGRFHDEKAFISLEHFASLRKHDAVGGDVVIAMLGDNLPRACVVPPGIGPALVKADCVRLRVDYRVALPEFVAYGLNSDQLRKSSAKLIHGVGRPRLGLTLLRDVPFPLAPLPEQARLVLTLDSYFSRLDDAVATLERVQRNLKRYRGSVLKMAVAGRLVPTEAELARAEKRDYEPASELLKRILVERRRRWEEAELTKLKAAGKPPKDDKWKSKYQDPPAPNTTDLPDLPQGWCWTTMPQLGELNRGKSKHRPRNDPRLLNGPYPFIQTGEVRRSGGFIESFDGTYSEFGLAQSKLWPAGTLCITIAANIAETGILKFDACFPDSVVGFLTEDPILTRYIEFFLRTAREGLDQYAPATAQKNINLETLSALAIPLPPRREQERLIEAIDQLLSVAEHNESMVESAVLRCKTLRQAILKWAFEGRLVDQDPADEPAALLLERIRSERAATDTFRERPRRAARTA